MKLRVDIRPYFKNVADYYWEDLELNDSAPHMSIWDWLYRDYQIIKIGTIGNKPQLWVSFPDEKMLSWFVLKWS